MKTIKLEEVQTKDLYLFRTTDHISILTSKKSTETYQSGAYIIGFYSCECKKRVRDIATGIDIPSIKLNKIQSVKLGEKEE